MTLAAHTVVKNIVDYVNNIFGTFSTAAQSLVASELGKVTFWPMCSRLQSSQNPDTGPLFRLSYDDSPCYVCQHIVDSGFWKPRP